MSDVSRLPQRTRSCNRWGQPDIRICVLGSPNTSEIAPVRQLWRARQGNDAGNRRVLLRLAVLSDLIASHFK